MTSDRMVERISSFMNGKVDEVTLENLWLSRMDGKTAVAFGDDDQIFQFKGIVPVSADEKHFIAFQCDGFDVMYDYTGKEDLEPLAVFENMECSNTKILDDGTVSKIMGGALFGDFTNTDLGNGFWIGYHDGEDELMLENESLVQDYEVQYVRDFGLPLGGISMNLGDFWMFFRSYTEVE